MARPFASVPFGDTASRKPSSGTHRPRLCAAEHKVPVSRLEVRERQGQRSTLPARSRRRAADAEESGALDQMDHLGCGASRQPMGSEARPGRDEGRNLAGDSESPVRRFGEQGNHQVLQRDHANAKLNQLGVCQRRNRRFPLAGSRTLARSRGSSAALVLPGRERRFPSLCREVAFWLSGFHEQSSRGSCRELSRSDCDRPAAPSVRWTTQSHGTVIPSNRMSATAALLCSPPNRVRRPGGVGCFHRHGCVTHLSKRLRTSTALDAACASRPTSPGASGWRDAVSTWRPWSRVVRRIPSSPGERR